MPYANIDTTIIDVLLSPIGITLGAIAIIMQGTAERIQETAMSYIIL